jgi:hypothetical protein
MLGKDRAGKRIFQQSLQNQGLTESSWDLNELTETPTIEKHVTKEDKGKRGNPTIPLEITWKTTTMHLFQGK